MGIRRRRKKINTILTTIDRRLKSVELQRVPRVVKDGTITRKMLEKSIQIDLASSTDSAEETPGTSTPKPPEFKDRPLTNIVEVRYRGYNEAGTVNDRDEATIVFETDPGLNVGDKLRFAATISALDVPSKTSEYKVESVGTVTISGQTYSTALYRPGRATIVTGTRTFNKGWRIREENVTLPVDSFDGDIDKYKYWQIKVYGKGTSPSTNDDFLYGPTWPAGLPTTSGTHMTGGTFDAGTLINIVGLGDPFDGTFKIINKTVVGTEITLKMEFKEYLASVTLPTSDGAIRAAAGRYLRDGETWTDTSFTPAVVWVWDEEKQLWINSSEVPEGTVIDDGIPPSPPTDLDGESEGYVAPDYRGFSRVDLTWTAPTTNSDLTDLSDLKGYKVYYRYSTNEGWIFHSDVATTSATVESLVPDRVVYFAVKAYDVSNNLSAFSQSFSINTVVGAIELNPPSAPVFTSKLGTVKVVWNGLDNAGATPPTGSFVSIEVHWSTTSGFTPSTSTLKGRLSDKSDSYSDTDLEYDTNYYFKFVFVDTFGVKSDPSAQTIVTVEPLVDTDLIEGSLSRWPFGANTIDVASLADGSIAATYLVSGSDAAGNAVRSEGKIAAGSIGAVAIAANSIVAGKIAADAITAREIKALSIEAGNIKANAITTDKLVAGTLTGFTIQTATSGARVQIGGSDITNIKFYDSSDVITGEVVATSSVLNLRNVKSGNGLWGTGSRSSLELGQGSATIYLNNGSFGASVQFGVTQAVFDTSVQAYGFSAGVGGIGTTGNISSATFAADSTSTRVTTGYIQCLDTFNRNVQSGRLVYVSNIGTYNSASSSERYKQDITPYEVDLEKLLSLEPVSFRYKQSAAEFGDNADIAHGFIAEQADSIGLTEFVDYEFDEEGNLRPDNFRYIDFTAALLGAIKKQQNTIELLSNKIEALESK